MIRNLFASISVIAMLTACSIKDSNQSKGIIDETETVISGTVLTPQGKALAKASVYLHGDSVEFASKLAKSSLHDSETTLQTTTDSCGHYQFQGHFHGKAHLEVDGGDSTGRLDSIDFTTHRDTITRKPDTLAYKGNIAVQPMTLDSGSSIWIPEVNRTVSITGANQALVILLPPGNYTIIVIAANNQSSAQLPGTVAVIEKGTTPVNPTLQQSSSSTTSSSASADTIANWAFNNPTNPLEDFTGLGHNGILGEGTLPVADTTLAFNGASGFRVTLATDLKRNNFRVETRVFPTSFSQFNNIITAEPPGNIYSGWTLRFQEKGKLVLLIRANGNLWDSVGTSALTPNAWYNIVAERNGTLTSLYVNGNLVAQKNIAGDISDLRYDFGVGYDAMNQAIHDRYFKGSMDYIRILAASSSLSSNSTQSSSSTATTLTWLAEWNFNNPTNLYQDSMELNPAILGEGTPSITDTTLILNGASGLVVKIDSTFMRNDFRIATRVYPTAFGSLNNIITAEPPGSLYSGWTLRFENTGFLSFYIRQNGNAWDYITTPQALSTNAWYDIIAERKGTLTSLYVNGTLVAQKDIAGDISNLQYNLGIGYDAMNQAVHSRYFSGQIDYIRYGSI